MAQQHNQTAHGVNTLKKFKKYEAGLKLGTGESFFPNSMIAEKLKGEGFTSVSVSGSGSSRKALGIWTRDALNIADLPKDVMQRITYIKEL